MINNERESKNLFHHFKADTADVHPKVGQYKNSGVVAFDGGLSYEPYGDSCTVRVLFLKGITIKMALKALDEIRDYITFRPQDHFER